MATKTPTQAERLHQELSGLQRTHHGLVVAKRGNERQIRTVLAQLGKLKPPAPPRELGAPWIPDYSEFQPGVDWQAVKAAGVLRAIAKATQYRTDFQFAHNWRSMEALRFAARGAYHFYTEQPPLAQAQRLLSAVAAAGGLTNGFHWDPHHGPIGDFLIVDFERAYGLSPALTRQRLTELVGELQRRVGARVMLYTGGPFWNQATDSWENDLGCILWHAAYVANPDAFLPAMWHPKLSRLWQFTDGSLGRRPHAIAGRSSDISVTIAG